MDVWLDLAGAIDACFRSWVAFLPIVDRAIGKYLPLPQYWMTLRWQPTMGLGKLSLLLALWH